jgi:TetR/AcrR family transcriptional repressor of mexJK operon
MSAVIKNIGPGRPKDLEKRAAILNVAKRMFTTQGFDSTSMDAIAAAAGVSKLTVYSHFQDKEQMPAEIFKADLKGPIRKQLITIARAFFSLITSEDAVAVHRTIVANARQSPKLAELFWDAGPKRTQLAFESFLRDEVDGGKLDIPDLHRATTQFFCLLKGEYHARMEFGCCGKIAESEIHEHIDHTVDFFLRAYAPR